MYEHKRWGFNNSGDTIQSIATSAFLPKIDKFFYYDNISSMPESETIYKVICNAYWQPNFFSDNVPDYVMCMDKKYNMSFNKEKLILTNNIIPLMISIYFPIDEWKDEECKLSDRVKNYLMNCGDIGARSLSTYSFLKKMD